MGSLYRSLIETLPSIDTVQAKASITTELSLYSKHGRVIMPKIGRRTTIGGDPEANQGDKRSMAGSAVYSLTQQSKHLDTRRAVVYPVIRQLLPTLLRHLDGPPPPPGGSTRPRPETPRHPRRPPPPPPPCPGGDGPLRQVLQRQGPRRKPRPGGHAGRAVGHVAGAGPALGRGWRPTTAFHLVYTESSILFELQIGDILRGLRSGDLGDLSPAQFRRVSELQCDTVHQENDITDELSNWQA
ncbi:hypothetical protein Acr_17g0006660 [Actinidia rufa]|uniref:Uncharacterized protein n=1 Tax=Actinidia rufa TaxID=165716 RepID=A0A7J0G2T5_9ERIC|nr:hypothetical protein Acr_17g0006660 [Actinidia rufa]